MQIGPQKGFAAGEGQIEGAVAQLGKDAAPLFHGHIIVGLAPHIASLALAIAAKTDANDKAKGEHLGPAQMKKAPIEGELGKQF